MITQSTSLEKRNDPEVKNLKNGVYADKVFYQVIQEILTLEGFGFPKHVYLSY